MSSSPRPSPGGEVGANDQPLDAGTARLELPPDVNAPRQARAWLESLLSDWPVGAVESARVLISEVVTNAVLHAVTPIVISGRLEQGGRRARIEVDDGHPAAPLPKRYSPDSPTGRGMQLIASLAEECGVKRTPQGKCVWFVIARDAAGDGSSSSLGQAWSATWEAVDRFHAPPDASADRAPAGSGMVRVVILQLPLEVYLEAEQHNDALMRELTLIAHSSTREPERQEVPRRLLELAAEVRAAFSTATSSLRAQVERARRRGDPTLDMHLDVPVVGWEALLRLATQLDELDRYCEEGDLLTLASPQTLRYFRKWYAQQVANQINGGAPTPWQPQETLAGGLRTGD